MRKMCYGLVDEKTIFIDLPDGLKMKAILRGPLTRPVVVMVHGLPGEGNETLQFLGARYLYEQGFSSLRLFLYSWDKETRNLADCTARTHATDLDTAVEYLRKRGATKIFAEGHSYGGLTILKAKSKLDGAVLWDPSHGLVFTDPEAIKYYENDLIEETGRFKLFLNGAGYIEPKAITKEQDEMGDNSADAAHKGYPLKIISAGQGLMTDYHKKYIAAADEPKEQVIIKEAHHQFEDSDEIMTGLFEETAKWFKDIVDGKL